MHKLSTGFPRFSGLWITLGDRYNESSKNMSNLQNPPTLNSLSPLGFWDDALGALARELSPQQFKTWIQPLSLVSYDESEQSLIFGAPNRFKLDWIKKTFSDRF